MTNRALPGEKRILRSAGVALTRFELRVLYLLHKHDGSAKHSVVSQGMSRVPALNRESALSSLEALELINSASTPPSAAGGAGAKVYWLTDVGKQVVRDLMDSGELKDPALERRSRSVR